MTLPFALAFLIAATPATPAPSFYATVISVGDGDTIRVKQDGKPITIRLACIDSPELKQEGGQDARQALSTIVPVGSLVEVRPHRFDLYRRLVAEVDNANLTMVSNGNAFVYRQYMSRCNKAAYNKAESEAQRQRLGVWAKPNVKNPWDFRKELKK